MKTSEIFDALLANLKVGETASTVAARRDEIAKALNKDFRSKDACTDYKLMVGSFGRHTAIKGVSDLDMIFIFPAGIRSDYDGETGPRRMLERVRDDLRARYTNTDIRVDQCVVRVQFTSNAFKFEVQPAFENADGSFDYPNTKAKGWKVTKPRDEISATKECNDRTLTNMRHLARMARDTEEFIEDRLPVDISETVSIDCEVTQAGWRPTWLRAMRRQRILLKADKSLKFMVTSCSVTEPYTLKWKVLNRGPEAERRDMVRGQIVDSSKPGVRTEHADFKGEHVVECYVVKDGVVVARDRLEVPISNTTVKPSAVS